ncbi:Protein TWIN LOV 1 isoform G [Glycine soja]|uniref:Protein TWIN LOV 1 isoform G n=1 Tax=Glycine soja TaxID=3848 RepID=A0A445LIL7_GLYSO|nr:Protein TWIN LOV 1 isoform G [Glycine soja]
MPMELEQELGSTTIQRSFDARYTRHARDSLGELPDSFTITDPSIPGHPIVFASPGFLKLTGYSLREVLGRPAAIFQGPRTSRKSVIEIREAVREERNAQVVLLNYRRDGTPFWMLFRVSPVFSSDGGAVVHFVAVQVPLQKKEGSGVRDFGFGCCRKEVCVDSLAEIDRVCSLEQVLEPDVRGLFLCFVFFFFLFFTFSCMSSECFVLKRCFTNPNN